jgi:hypothetical protein
VGVTIFLAPRGPFSFILSRHWGLPDVSQAASSGFTIRSAARRPGPGREQSLMRPARLNRYAMRHPPGAHGWKARWKKRRPAELSPGWDAEISLFLREDAQSKRAFRA